MNAVDFISTLVMHFPVRHESEMREREWLGSMIGAVKHYEGDILQRAAQTIIDTRTDRRFPLPAEIRKVCFEIASDERRSKLAFEGGEKGVGEARPSIREGVPLRGGNLGAGSVEAEGRHAVRRAGFVPHATRWRYSVAP